VSHRPESTRKNFGVRRQSPRFVRTSTALWIRDWRGLFKAASPDESGLPSHSKFRVILSYVLPRRRAPPINQFLYVLIHEDCVAIRIGNHEAGRAAGTLVGFGDHFDAARF